MISLAKQCSLVNSAFFKSIEDFKRTFFIGITTFSIPVILSIIISSPHIYTHLKTWFFLILCVFSFFALPLSRFCFLNFAVTWHSTHKFSIKSFVSILKRFHVLFIAICIEGIFFRMVPFNQLFIGYFAVLIVKRNSLWQSFSKSAYLSKEAWCFPLLFFFIEFVRVINAFPFMYFLTTHYESYLLVHIVHILLVLALELFFLLFKLNAYELVSAEILNKSLSEN